MTDVKYWVALDRVPQLGPARFQRLEAYFGALEHAWRASPSGLRAAGLDEGLAGKVVAARAGIDPDHEMDRLERSGVQVLSWNHHGYPRRLKEIHDPPPLLYVKGRIESQDERALAVVGTRSPTAYGKEAAANLTTGLARSGICIVSGLARGIDAVAHRSALESGGRTIGVVANGLDTVYPPEHVQLARQMQEQGAVVSEYPLGVRPEAKSFPRRNRLISGMTLGTLVVEAAEGSGARWTVYHGLDQDREVFCVPGSIFSPASKFTNRMIQQGAKLVSDYRDVLEELNLGQFSQEIATNQPELPLYTESSPSKNVVEATGEEKALLDRLGADPVHIDDLARNAGLPITDVSCTLTMLELKGMVKQVGCMHYVNAVIREVAPIYGA